MIKKLIVGSMQTNCYIIYNDNKECIIIDPGAQGQKINKYIIENELNPLAIFITHGHFDHIGATDYLVQKFHCPIYTHELTKELLYDSSLNLSFYESPFVLNSDVVEVADEFKVGDFQFEWMLLEGHCQGSSMIHYKNENIVFSGDVLFKESIGRFDFPTSSRSKTRQTLQVIQTMKFNGRILPGHGDETTLQHELQYNYYLKS